MSRLFRSLRGHVWMPLLLLALIVLPFVVHAAEEADPTTLLDEIGKIVFGPGKPELQTVIGKLIQLALSFVGTIFFALMLYAGFLWMTAQGETEKVEKARSILIQATIGIVIIALAYTITFAVIEGISGALK